MGDVFNRGVTEKNFFVREGRQNYAGSGARVGASLTPQKGVLLLIVQCKVVFEPCMDRVISQFFPAVIVL